MTTQSNRIVIWKLCKAHRKWDVELNAARLERECSDCRSSIFRATMRARGIKLGPFPSYKGDYPPYYNAGPGWVNGRSFDDSPGRREPGVFANPEAIPGWD